MSIQNIYTTSSRLFVKLMIGFVCIALPTIFSRAQKSGNLANRNVPSIESKEIDELISKASTLKLSAPDSAIVILGGISKMTSSLQNDEKYDFQIRIINEIGNSFRLKGSYPQAIKSYEMGIQFATLHNLNLRKAKLLNALGGLYQEIEDTDKALTFCKAALTIYQTDFPNEKRDLTMLLANVGNLLIIGKNITESKQYLNRAKELNQELNDDYVSSLIFSGLGVVAMHEENYEAAFANFKIGIDAASRIQSQDTKLAILANIGNTFIKMKKYHDAEQMLLPAYKDAVAIKHKYLIKEILALLVVLYSETEDYKKAFVYQKEYSDLKSDLFSEELNERIASFEVKIKNIEKEKEILELNQINEKKSFELRRNQFVLFFVSTLSILILALIWFYYQRAKHKNVAKIYQMQNQMFRLQMKPHFIFNVLSSIGGYMNQNNSQEAGIYLAKFARLIRNVLEHSNNELIELKKEIELLKYYLDLQQLRFPDRFNYSIHFDENVEQDVLFIPHMIIQPIVENAIEHGFSTLTSTGNLAITISCDDDSLTIEIVDNGVGLNQKNTDKKKVGFSDMKKESMSSQLIVQHLNYYKMRYKRDFKITFEDISDVSNTKSGTKVRIDLPLIHDPE